MNISGSATGFSFYRVTNSLQNNLMLGSINSSMSTILQLQQQISSGYRILKPSDDPLGANRTLQIQSMLEENERYKANVQSADHRLSATEIALMEMDDLLDTAKTIMLREVGSTSTPESRENSAIEIDNILNQAVSIANRKFGSHYLFGGALSGANPFELLSTAVTYNGDEVENFLRVSDGIIIAANIPGSGAFGALSAEILGDADLDPDVTAATMLSELNGGEGVASGSITVGDGLTTTTIDLSGAETVGDVIDIINNDSAGFVTATINAAGNGIELDTTTTGNISVIEVDDGTTASDLGVLRQTLAAGPLVGSDVDPSIRALTSAASLLGGAGLSNPASQISITNGDDTATIDFVGCATVQDILNKINHAGVNVVAGINEAGDGINVVSKSNGARLSIEDVGGGASASELGLFMGLERVKLDDLNDGIGVACSFGEDIRIICSDGTVIEIDISDAETVGDVIDIINNDPENTGGLVAASVAATNDRIILTDNSGGAGDLVVENVGAGFAAGNLGIAGTVANAAPPMVMTGENLSPVGVQTQSVFTALLRLRDALNDNDTAAITRAGAMIDAAKGKVLNSVAEVGARVQRLQSIEQRLDDEQYNLTEALSGLWVMDSTQTAEAIVKLQNEQTIFQAGLASASLMLQTTLLNYL